MTDDKIYIHGAPQIVHEIEKLKKENEVLRGALENIKRQVKYYISPDELSAFTISAGLAHEALEQADKIREGK